MRIKTILLTIAYIFAILSFSGCIKAPDTDGDSFRDPVDAFPEDPSEWEDSDEDGVGDNAENAAGSSPLIADTDGDGISDLLDLDPLNPNVGADRDGDKYHDAIDAFPDDPYEWADTDGDGYGDNADRYPKDPKYHTSTPKLLTNFSHEMIDAITIFENGTQGGEYTIAVTNNEIYGGNFSVTVHTCNKVERIVDACVRGTIFSASTKVYVGPGETKQVTLKVITEYITQRSTFKKWVVVDPPWVQQPG